MAENHDGQEKSFEPTARRLDEARRRGQVPRSRELNTVAVTLAGVVTAVALAGVAGDQLQAVLIDHFNPSRVELFEPGAVVRHLSQGLHAALAVMAPFFLATVVAALLASVALGGIQVSGEALRLDFG